MARFTGNLKVLAVERQRRPCVQMDVETVRREPLAPVAYDAALLRKGTRRELPAVHIRVACRASIAVASGVALCERGERGIVALGATDLLVGRYQRETGTRVLVGVKHETLVAERRVRGDMAPDATGLKTNTRQRRVAGEKRCAMGRSVAFGARACVLALRGEPVRWPCRWRRIILKSVRTGRVVTRAAVERSVAPDQGQVAFVPNA